MVRKYKGSDREKAREVVLNNRLVLPCDYPPDRPDGELYLNLNGIETYIHLEPAGNITQWKSTINGILFRERSGMHHIYRELALMNPPARNFE